MNSYKMKHFTLVYICFLIVFCVKFCYGRSFAHNATRTTTVLYDAENNTIVPKPCEMFYDVPPSTNGDKWSGFCVKSRGRMFSVDEQNYKVLRIYCEGDLQAKSNNVTSTASNLFFVNCPIGPSAFLREILYPTIHHFTSKYNSNSIIPNNSFHGICKVQSVRLSGNGIETVQSRAFDCLRDITLLDLSDNNIELLPPTVFGGMHGLKNLYLQKNHLLILPLGIFDDMESLKKLKLGSNSIAHLPEEIFQNQKNLNVLLLNGNTLETLGPGLVSDLAELEYLCLSGNNLKNLRNTFWNNSKLARLDISGNAELQLDNDVFSHLSGLEYLEMRGCNLTSLPSKLFSKSSKLSHIDIGKNHLQEVSPETFGPLKNLENLDASNNGIVRLREQPFRESTLLKYLNLSGNHILEIKDDVFLGISHLLVLDLSFNAIESIADDSFDDLIKLTSLNISHNKLTTINNPHILKNLRKLRDLDLSHNNLNGLTLNFSYNPLIRHLYLSKNDELNLTESSLHGLFSLVELHLEDCNLRNLPNKLFENTHILSKLFLPNNSLPEITPETFGELHQLTTLDISFNNVTKLVDKPFHHHRRMLSINLSGNKLSNIESLDFLGLSSLEELDLSLNSIQTIAENSFDDMQMLVNLNISHNKIAYLPGYRLFRYNERLHTIDVSYNFLTDFRNIDWEHLVSLEKILVTKNQVQMLYIPKIRPIDKDISIHLEWNQILGIRLVWNQENNTHREFLEEKKKIGFDSHAQIFLYLAGNPIDCDCEAYNIYEHMLSSTGHHCVEILDNLTCGYPEDQRGKDILSVKEDEFFCNIEDACPSNCSCIFTGYNGQTSVNCSGRGYYELPSVAPPNTTVLHIKDNKLSSLMSLKDSVWENLVELNAENNRIVSEEFFIPRNMKNLYLKNNKLATLPKTIQAYTKEAEKFDISLSKNTWTCDCSILPLKTYLSEYKTQVTDSNDVRCRFPNNTASNYNLLLMKDFELCPRYQFSYISLAYYVISVVLMLCLILFSIFYYTHKLHILSFMYSYCHGFYMLFCCDRAIEEDKEYDCFISYSSEDQDVTLSILQELENIPPFYYKFCIHERNWLPGEYITANIVNSVQSSRKTLIILSETFLKSKWFHLEFQAAYHQTLQDRKNRLIVVIKGEVPDKDELEKDVQFFISTKTYLKWGERWFWEKLRYAIHEESTFTEPKKDGFFKKMLSCWKKDKEDEKEVEEDDTNHEVITLKEKV